jgi:hypothetical protein
MRYSARGLGRFAFSLFAVLCSAAGAAGQSMTVSASAGAPSPNPACVGQQITSSLSASVSNPPPGPTSPFNCPLNGPVWS